MERPCSGGWRQDQAIEADNSEEVFVLMTELQIVSDLRFFSILEHGFELDWWSRFCGARWRADKYV